MHKDNERRFSEAITAGERRFAGAVADIKDVMHRMSRILQHHGLTLDDHKDRLGRFEEPGQSSRCSRFLRSERRLAADTPL